jgi:hypothetical protein
MMGFLFHNSLHFKKQLQAKFDMIKLKLSSKYLGLEIKHHRHGDFVH